MGKVEKIFDDVAEEGKSLGRVMGFEPTTS
ncbi:MAG: hypothetical protein JWN98_2074 [Abditibacteriota bacterium]|nr:hypothetical protein [Abditibacteriota bacterium]